MWYGRLKSAQHYFAASPPKKYLGVRQQRRKSQEKASAGLKFMDEKRFRKNDSGFVCANCGLKVEPLGYTSRNHCPRCLGSLHVDVNPGGRAAGCGGIMCPVKAEPDARRGYIITHRCERCGHESRCRSAHEAQVQPDDIELLISLTRAE